MPKYAFWGLTKDVVLRESACGKCLFNNALDTGEEMRFIDGRLLIPCYLWPCILVQAKRQCKFFSIQKKPAK